MFDPQLTLDQKEQLNRFVKEAYNYNKTHNLFVRDSEEAIYNKDIKDCWPALEHIKKNESVLDIGTGAGFPGIVLAIFNKNPKFHVKLYEKSNIKCDFLETIKNKLNLGFHILGRYQDEQIETEYVVSRAFKQLDEILRISREIIRVNHKLIVLKGKNAENEINKLQQPLEFIYKLEKSITDINSRILIVEVKK